jgi:hypothetical protein
MQHDIDLPSRPRQGVHSKEDDNDCIKFSDLFVLLSFNSSSNLYRHWKFILRFVKHDSWTVSEPGLLLEGSPKGWFIVVDHVRSSSSFPWDYYAFHVVQKKRLELSYSPFDR